MPKPEIESSAAEIVAILSENGLPTRRERAGFVARLRDRMGLTFRQIGKQLNVTPQRAHQLYVLHRLLSKPIAENEDEDGIEPKEFTAPASFDEAIQQLTKFLNEKGLRGEFKIWPKGTYPGSDSEFTLTMSGFLADAMEEGWTISEELDLLLRRMGLNYEMENRTTMRFFHDEYSSDSAPEPQSGGARVADLDIEI